MFFTEFDPLTKEYTDQALRNKPEADGKACGVLSGRKFALHLNGEYAPEELAYEFISENRLKVTENGKTFEAPYKAISLGKMTVMTHLIPDTDRGWHLIIDRENRTVTAFETWFGITVPVGLDFSRKSDPLGYRDIPREVQREYYFGWLDNGNEEAPEKLDTTTNRIEGRGLYWKYEDGRERLTFNPAVNCTTIVELGDEKGGITMANPADYIRIDDVNYIYARWEVEYSGKMWIELMNFFEMKAVGVEFGFEEDNSLTYKTHTADLTITGDAAHLEMITDHGDVMVKSPYMKGKGARYSYRPGDMHLPMSHETAMKYCEGHKSVFDDVDNGIMASGNNFEACDDLAGKEFRVWNDHEKYAQAPWTGDKGDPWEYRMISGSQLSWRHGGEWQEARYLCFNPDKNLYFFSHLLEGDERYAMVAHVVDFDNGLATTVYTGIGSWRSPWEAGAQVFFGTLEYGDLKAPFARRHYFTDELLGRCFAWNYSETMNSIHVYSSPESSSWTIMQKDNSGGASWSSPCFYIKLRPDVYLFQWIEEKCNGGQGLVVMNRKIQHDGGFWYCVEPEQLRLSTTGAYMRELGRFDIHKYFDKGIR